MKITGPPIDLGRADALVAEAIRSEDRRLPLRGGDAIAAAAIVALSALAIEIQDAMLRDRARSLAFELASARQHPSAIPNSVLS